MGNCQYQRTKKAIFTDSKSIVDLLQNDQKKFYNYFPEEKKYFHEIFQLFSG